MANKKFSEFVLKTNTSGVSHIVGYSGTENVQITPANFVTTGGTGIFLPLAGGTMTGALVVDSTATVNDILTAGLGLAVTGGTVGSGKLVLASSNKVHLSGGSAGLILQNSGGTKSLTIDDTLSTFVGLVSGITPVDAANFVTKAYLDGGGGAGNGFLPLAGGTMLGNLKLNDNVRSIYGTNNDLEIYNDGSNSFIQDVGAGSLFLKTNGTGIFFKETGGETLAQFLKDGAVNLYHNNVLKFATTNTGIAVTGNGTFTGSVSITEIASIINDSGISGLQIRAKADNICYIDFGDSADANIGGINYSNVTDTLNFRTGNSNKVTLDASGNLGIGVDTPLISSTYKSIVSSGTAGVIIRNKIGSASAFDLQSDAAANYLFGYENRPMVFATNGSEKMRLTSVGDLLVRQTDSAVFDTNTGSSVAQFWGNQFSSSSNTLNKVMIGTGNNVSLIGGSKSNTANKFIVSSYMRFGSTNNTAGAEAGEIKFYTQAFGATASEKVLISSSGQLGLGTSTPSARITLADHTTADGGIKFRTAASSVNLWSSGSGNLNTDGSFNVGSRMKVAGGQAVSDPDIGLSSAGGIGFSRINTNDIAFATSSTERMRLTSAGELLIGTTTTLRGNKFHVNANNLLAGFNVTGGTGEAIALFSNGTVVGSISVTGSATAYNTTSDYRLKEDLQDFKGLDLVSKIPVYDYKWKADESRSYGVMAHELEEVLPQAVSGEKDAEEMQSVDYSKIVPVLVKAIQELKAEIELLKK